MGEISWRAERLLAYQGLCSVEFVSSKQTKEARQMAAQDADHASQFRLRNKINYVKRLGER
jgi:hypothetical protein